MSSISQYRRQQLRDALRLALQSAAAAAVAYSVMESFDLEERFVGVLSAVLVVQPSLGTTIGAAGERLAATLVGCVIGIVCLVLLPHGYGTAGALAISMLVMNGIAAFRADWRYGVVAAVALALGGTDTILETALERLIAIGCGVVIGIVVSFVVWPEKSESRVERHIRNALQAATELLDKIIQQATSSAGVDSEKVRRRFVSELNAAQETAGEIRFADNETLREKIKAVERFHHGLTVINRVAKRTDDVVRGNDAFADDIAECKSLTSEIAAALVSGDTDVVDQRAALKDCLRKLRDVAHRNDHDATSHLQQTTLVFALEEVQASLDRLYELYAN